MRESKRWLTLVLALLTFAVTGCDRKAPNQPETDTYAYEINKEAIETELPKPQEESKPQEKPIHDNEYLYVFDAAKLIEPITEIDMVLVEGGTMEIQGKEISLDSFYMSKYVLNNFIYATVHNWAYEREYPMTTGKRLYSPGGSMNESFEWPTAIAYCNYLSIMEGLTPVYLLRDKTGPVLAYKDIINSSGPVPGVPSYTYHSFYIDWDADGYRLPTEAEWEYAARGGNQSRGYVYSGSDALEEVLTNYRDYNFNTEYIPGQRKPNELGIHDMSSQSSEWCIGPWTEYGKMEPAHNPGRIVVFEFVEPFFLIQKGGGYNMGQDAYRPEARLKFQPDSERNDFDRESVRVSLRPVRKAE